MSDVGKFVRHAMGRMSPGEHPDENLLGAFSEGTLPQRERDRILAHFSECAQCREVVALSMPEEPQPVPASPLVQRHRLRWPVLRWAGAMAALVIVATAVLLQKSRIVEQSVPHMATRQEQNGTSPSAKEPSPPLMDRTTSDDRAKEEGGFDARVQVNRRADIRKDQASSANIEKKANELPRESAAGNSKAPNAPAPQQNSDRALAKAGLTGGTQPRDELQASQQRAQTSDAQKQQTQLEPQNYAPPREQVMVAGAAPAPAPATEALKTSQQQAASPQTVTATAGGSVAVQSGPLIEKQKQQSSSELDQRKISGAAESIMIQSDKGGQSLSKRMESNEISASRAPMMKASTIGVRWRLSSRGAVERSNDAGRSWHGVAVSALNPVFRSISVVGADVWAGGTGGALYHSLNAGTTWTRVNVKSEDMVLADDIVRVDFTDSQHGSITVASGAIWATSDAGATWNIGH